MSRKIVIFCVFFITVSAHFFVVLYKDSLWISGAHYAEGLLSNWRERNSTRTQKHQSLDNSTYSRPFLPFSNYEELRKLGSILHKRLDYIQNPQSCTSRKKILCLLHSCGLGCTVNGMATCLMIAYATNRTAVVEPRLPKSFKPLSSICLDVKDGNRSKYNKDHENYDVVEYSFLRNTFRPQLHPPAIPDDMFNIIKRYHDHPFVWWAGQFSSYVLRLTDSAKNASKVLSAMPEFQRPVVGIHIRRTDKKLEPGYSYRKVEEYMTHVEKWFSESPNATRRIYLATDDPKVVEEIKKKYPRYIVINNLNATSYAVVKHRRNSDVGRLGIYYDLFFLSKCDYIVCTYSSNVCRLTFNIMNADRGNVSMATVKSLDKDWSFGRDTKIKPPFLGYSMKMPHYPISLDSDSP